MSVEVTRQQPVETVGEQQQVTEQVRQAIGQVGMAGSNWLSPNAQIRQEVNLGSLYLAANLSSRPSPASAVQRALGRS